MHDGEGFARLEDYHPKRRFRPVRFKNIPLSAGRPYLVKSLIPREGLVLIWGPPKCGKSFWAFDVTLHIALGWSYRGRRVEQGTVAYVACEGERGLGARAEAFRIAKLAENGDADPPFYLLATRLDLAADADDLIADIRAEIGSEHCAAIVIDTLNRSLSGSESRDEDMSDYVKAADRLREAFKAAVIIIHHCGHNPDRPRGHTSLLGAVDAEIAVKRDDAGNVLATVKNMKDGPDGDEIMSRLAVVELGFNDDGEPITSCFVETVDAPDVSRARPKRAKLTAKEQIALDALRKALGADGQPAPGSNHVPSGKLVVSIDLWRRFYLAATGENEQPENTRRVALNRSREALQSKGIIGTWNEIVWEI